MIWVMMILELGAKMLSRVTSRCLAGGSVVNFKRVKVSKAGVATFAPPRDINHHIHPFYLALEMS